MEGRRAPFALDALVYDAIAQAGRALSAYEVVAALQERHPLAPQQAYRIIARLEADARIRRVESVNGYRVCNPEEADTPILVCHGCHSCVTVRDAGTAVLLAQLALQAGFRMARSFVEGIGKCPECRTGMDPSAHAH